MPAQTLTLLVTSSLKTQDVPSSRCRAHSMSILGLIWNSACQLPVGGACSSLTSQRDHCSFPKIALGRERERENGNGQTHSLRGRVRTCLSSTGQIQPASALQAQSPKEAPSEQTHMLGVDPLQCTACMLWKQFLFTWRTSSSQHLSLGYIVFSFGVSRNHICCKSHITNLGFRSVSLCASFTLWQIALEQEGTRHWPALGYIFQQTLWKLVHFYTAISKYI